MGTVNDRLENLRKHLGLTQTDFANIIGIKQPTYSQILKGKSNLTTTHLKRLVEAVRANPLWILTGEGNRFIEKDDNQAAVSAQMVDPSLESIDLLYNYVLKKRGVELTKIQGLKFRTACARCYIDNPDLESLEDLSIAANIYLNFILRFPDIEI